MCVCVSVSTSQDDNINDSKCFYIYINTFTSNPHPFCYQPMSVLGGVTMVVHQEAGKEVHLCFCSISAFNSRATPVGGQNQWGKAKTQATKTKTLGPQEERVQSLFSKTPKAFSHTCRVSGNLDSNALYTP